MSEVHLYGDVRLRFLSMHDGFVGAFLPGYVPVTDSPPRCFGLQRLDHAVGNVHKLEEALDYVMGFTARCSRGVSDDGCGWVGGDGLLPALSLSPRTPPRNGIRRAPHAFLFISPSPRTAQGFHVFAEFVAEDVGTLDSGLNSAVLASNNELARAKTERGTQTHREPR